MTLPLPDGDVERGSWEAERTGVQRNFDFVAQRFPLECSTDHFRQVPQARVYNSVNLPIANTTFTALTFDSERYDVGTTTEQHSTTANTGRLTCRVPGLYSIKAAVYWATSGTRVLFVRVNGATQIADHEGTYIGTTISTDYRLAAGDFVELVVWQNSGGALNMTANPNSSPELMWHWVSP